MLSTYIMPQLPDICPDVRIIILSASSHHLI